MCEQQVEQLVATITYRILWISHTNAETSIRSPRKPYTQECPSRMSMTKRSHRLVYYVNSYAHTRRHHTYTYDWGSLLKMWRKIAARRPLSVSCECYALDSYTNFQSKFNIVFVCANFPDTSFIRAIRIGYRSVLDSLFIYISLSKSYIIAEKKGKQYFRWQCHCLPPKARPFYRTELLLNLISAESIWLSVKSQVITQFYISHIRFLCVTKHRNKQCEYRTNERNKRCPESSGKNQQNTEFISSVSWMISCV